MLVILLFLIIWFYYRMERKRQGFTPSVLVMLVFIGSLFLSCIYYFYNSSLYHFGIISTIYYALSLIMFFLPLSFFSGKMDDVQLPKKTLDFFSWIIIVGGAIYIIITISNINIVEVLMNWGDMRGEYYKEYGDSKIATNIYERIASNIYPLLFFALPLAFYHYSHGNRKMSTLLFIASTSLLVYGFSIAARQEFVLWILGFASSFLMFNRGLSKKNIKKMIIISTILVGGVGAILYIATMSRFGETDALGSLFGYTAAQPYNAGYFLEKLGSQRLWGQANFCYLVGKPYITEYNNVINSPEFLNVFGSIVGSYYLDFGYFSLFFIILVAVFFVSFMRYFKKRGSILFFYMYVIYLNMMIVGVFYNKYVDPPSVRAFFLIGLLLYFYEQFTSKKIQHNGVNNSSDI